jgi:hypothetical protein
MLKIILKFLIGIAIVWLIVILLLTVKKPKIGVIDSQALIASQSHKIAAFYPNGNLPSEQLQLVARQIKTSITAYAKAHNLILLAKGAVWGGEIVDHTDNLINILKQE